MGPAGQPGAGRCGASVQGHVTASGSPSVPLPPQAYVEDVFGRPVRNGQVILENKKQGGNVLTAEFMQEFFGLWESIWTLKATYQGEEIALRDVCFKPGGDVPSSPIKGCSVTSVLDLFNYTRADVPTTDAGVLDLVNQANPTSVGGRALRLSFALGGIRREGGRIVSAKAASLSFQLEDKVVVSGGDEESPEAEAWEEKFLELVRSTTLHHPHDAPHPHTHTHTLLSAAGPGRVGVHLPLHRRLRPALVL